MANVNAWLNADDHQRPTFCMDDGCNMSCISAFQFAQDRQQLDRAGEVHKLANTVPVFVRLASMHLPSNVETETGVASLCALTTLASCCLPFAN